MTEFFFVRHINDYNYNRNFRSLKPKAKLVLVEKIDEVEEDYFELFPPLLCLVRRVFTKLNIKNRFLYRLVIAKFEKKYSEQLTGESVTFFFDHTNDGFTKLMVEYFRAEYGVRMIALPHANHILQNKILDKGVTKPQEKLDLSFFDRVVCSSATQSSLFLGSLLVLEDYQKFALKKYESDLDRDIQILILHSKFVGNVNDSEFIRMLDMINEAQLLGRVFVKLHPRSSRKELQLFDKHIYPIEISERQTDLLIRRSRYVFIIQTSVIFDALEYGCNVVILNYMTTNVLEPALMEFCIVLESPDDLYNFLHQEALCLKFEPKKVYEPVKNIFHENFLEEIYKC